MYILSGFISTLCFSSLPAQSTTFSLFTFHFLLLQLLFSSLPAPEIAVNYWKLSDKALMRDVILAIRQFFTFPCPRFMFMVVSMFLRFWSGRTRLITGWSTTPLETSTWTSKTPSALENSFLMKGASKGSIFGPEVLRLRKYFIKELGSVNKSEHLYLSFPWFYEKYVSQVVKFNMWVWMFSMNLWMLSMTFVLWHEFFQILTKLQKQLQNTLRNNVMKA